MAVYVLVAIVKKRLGLEQSFYTILQILSVSTFEKMPILSLFHDVGGLVMDLDNVNQLNLL